MTYNYYYVIHDGDTRWREFSPTLPEGARAAGIIEVRRRNEPTVWGALVVFDARGGEYAMSNDGVVISLNQDMVNKIMDAIEDDGIRYESYLDTEFGGENE